MAEVDAQHRRTPIATEPPKKVDPFKNVPDLIEERRKESDGSITSHRFMKGALLGKGGFAQVFVSTLLPSKDKYALKIVAKSTLLKPRAKQKLQTEIQIHQALIHENVVRFNHCFEDINYTYMILELCSNNSMSEMMNHRKRITECESRFYLSQLVCSLQYLHRHLVIHRDLKLGNLFIDRNMRLKVGDFGLAAKLESPNEKRMTVCGTPNYIAPELLEGKKGHSFEVDIWSTGIILYTFLVGKPPFQSKDVKSTYKRILSNVYSYPDGLSVSHDAKDLIASMLQGRPENRPSLQQIISHPFFTSPGVYIPASLPVTSLKEVPMLLPPPASHVSSTAATMQKVQANSMKTIDPLSLKAPATVYNNENNPNAANQQHNHRATYDEAPQSFGLRRNVGTMESMPSSTLHLQENNHVEKLNDEKQAALSAGRSISARMRTALAPRTTNQMPVASSSSQEKFSVQATMPTTVGSEHTNAIGSKEVKSSSLSTRTGTSKYSTITSSSSTTAMRQPKFDIYVDSAAEESQPTTLLHQMSTRSQQSKFSETTQDLLAATTNRPQTTESSSKYATSRINARDTLNKITRGFDDMKILDEESSPEQRISAGQKRADISTKDAPVYTPTDRQHKSKRVKEAWSSQPVKVLAPESEPMQMVCTPDNMIKATESAKLGTLEAMHEMLDQSINVMEKRRAVSNQVSTMDAIAIEPSVKTWVVRYVDYSSKYGLGYLFNNGSAGVYFNDSTKIVLSADGKVFQYIERIKRESSFGSESSSQKYSMDNYPQELHKKVTLLKHFRNYLVDQVNSTNDKTIGMEDNIADTAAFRSACTKDVTTSATALLGETLSLDDDMELPYVKKWVRTKHALLFRLNNRTVQVVFYDKSEILLSSEARLITYVNKTGERSEHALDDMLANRVDIAKRLKYTKDIMHRLISTQSQK